MQHTMTTVDLAKDFDPDSEALMILELSSKLHKHIRLSVRPIYILNIANTMRTLIRPVLDMLYHIPITAQTRWR